MSRLPDRRLRVIVVLGMLIGTAVLPLRAQQAPHPEHGDHATPQGAAEHGAHQTPEGWKFTWPMGEPIKGREVFVKLECYSCHEVKGETFPVPSEAVGPELSMMAPLHDKEYFAEAIINPNAVIQKGRVYEAADGSSKMPSYNDLLTVQELIDLVAYLKGLKPPAESPASHGSRSGSSSGHGGH
jgi:mono/diheme cytochrome c family protein